MPRKSSKHVLAVLVGVAVFSFSAAGKEKTCADECREETAICVKMCTKGVKQQGGRGRHAEAAIAKCKTACKEVESDCLDDCSKER